MRTIAIAVGTALLMVLVVSATAGGTTGKPSVTLHLVEKEQGSNFIDNPPKQGPQSAPLMGDESADTSALLTRSGKHAGHLETTCVATTGGPKGSAVCTGIYSLKGGMLIGMARVEFARPSVSIAVTGGTGVYEGVTGSGTSTHRGNGPFSDDTLHLVWP